MWGVLNQLAGWERCGWDWERGACELFHLWDILPRFLKAPLCTILTSFVLWLSMELSSDWYTGINNTSMQLSFNTVSSRSENLCLRYCYVRTFRVFWEHRRLGAEIYEDDWVVSFILGKNSTRRTDHALLKSVECHWTSKGHSFWTPLLSVYDGFWDCW